MAKKSNIAASDRILMALSFLPYINTATLFRMNNKAPKKQWRRNGWIILFINLFLIIGLITLPFFRSASEKELPDWPDGKPETVSMPENMPIEPRIDDFVEDANIFMPEKDYEGEVGYDEYIEAKEKYQTDFEAYKKTEEYAQYLKDTESYDKALEEYENSSEYKAYEKQLKEVHEYNSRIVGNIRIATTGIIVVMFISNLIMFFYIMSQRRNYEMKLQQDGNRDAVMSKLGKKPVQQHSQPADRLQDADFPAAPPVQTTTQPSVQNAPAAPQAQPAAVQQSISEGALDINSATEEQLSSLPGLTIIDARRAIAYRDENGGFKTTDEFFTAISAKPHIMVRVEPLVTVSEVQPAQQSKPHEQSGSRRTIDL